MSETNGNGHVAEALTTEFRTAAEVAQVSEIRDLANVLLDRKHLPTGPYIYGLVDPLEFQHVRYVGMAMKPKRPFEHARNARKGHHSHLFHWIRLLQSEGREPTIFILEQLTESATRNFVGDVERMYIAALREIGHRLTNVSAGGWGGETRKGSTATAETRRKLSLAHAGVAQHWRGEQRGSAKLTGAQVLAIRADPRTQREIALEYGVAAPTISLIKSRKKWDHIEGPPSVPSRGRRASMLGNTHGVGHTHQVSDEVKAILRAKHLGRKHSEATKERIRQATSIALKRSWAQRKLLEESDV